MKVVQISERGIPKVWGVDVIDSTLTFIRKYGRLPTSLVYTYVMI